jgi:hypothetical protein
MNTFAVLTNRKRALIALIHSVVFLGVALHGFAAPKAGIVHGAAPAGDFVLVMIYLTVTAVLAWLAGISRCAAERLYFILCASSATSGLLRAIFGDPALPAAQYLRVVMLTAAVLVGTWVARSFSRSMTEEKVVLDEVEEI